MIKVHPSNRLLFAPTFALGILTFSLPAQSAVTVYFEQLGGDVKVSWSGILNMPSNIQTSSTRAIGATIGAAHNFTYFLDHSFGPAGNFENTGVPTTTAVRASETEGSWGFNGPTFIWSSHIVSIGTEAAPVQLSFDPAKQFLLLESTTLLAIGATSFDDTLAWTATSNDTISYTTGSPVPEPSSLGLIIVSSLGLVTLRRR